MPRRHPSRAPCRRGVGHSGLRRRTTRVPPPPGRKIPVISAVSAAPMISQSTAASPWLAASSSESLVKVNRLFRPRETASANERTNDANALPKFAPAATSTMCSTSTSANSPVRNRISVLTMRITRIRLSGSSTISSSRSAKSSGSDVIVRTRYPRSKGIKPDQRPSAAARSRPDHTFGPGPARSGGLGCLLAITRRPQGKGATAMKARRAAVLAAVTLTTVLAAPGAATAATRANLDLRWELKDTGTTAQLRGLSVVSRDVVWASGRDGTVLRTTDGGRTFASVGPEGTENLDFRDVEAFDADTAVVLSIGNGSDSRI